MIWMFIATIFSGLGAAGIALAIRAVTRKKAPKWLIPVFAGAGMLGFLIYSEYIWFDLKQSQLPDGVVIVGTETEGIFWRPLTFIAPYVTAFTAVDTQSIERSDDNTDVVSFTLYRFEQKLTESVSHRVHILHCRNRELVQLDPQGRPLINGMKRLDSSDSLYQTVCR